MGAVGAVGRKLLLQFRLALLRTWKVEEDGSRVVWEGIRRLNKGCSMLAPDTLPLTQLAVAG
jgi:hypothetical protein